MSVSKPSALLFATMMFAPAPAMASIVHTIPSHPIAAMATPGHEALARLDIDNDGIAEFTLRAENGLWSEATIVPARAGAFLRFTNGEDLERRDPGELIGPEHAYAVSHTLVFYNTGFTTGPYGLWEYNAPTAFFGFKFEMGGRSHFGWARSQTTDTAQPSANGVTVFDYAYETTPDTAIPAGAVPSPGAAALLALASLTGVRRKRS